MNSFPETVHLYVVREASQEKHPYFLLPALLAIVCVLSMVGVTVYSGQHPAAEEEILRVPATFLPLHTFTTSVLVIPTGVKRYPAAYASGILTLSNGSVLAQHLPTGMLFRTAGGLEVVTTESADVPAGNGTNYGEAFVRAQAVSAGVTGNLAPLAINEVYGTSLYIRNDQAFQGGEEAYTQAFIQPSDTASALVRARGRLIALILDKLLFAPCREQWKGSSLLRVSWTCQLLTYAPVAGRVLSSQVQGTWIVLDVERVARPHRLLFK